jgi:hypothetical protein
LPYFSAVTRALQATDELVVNRGVDDQPVDRHADLSLMEERAEHGAADRELQVRVLQDDAGGITTELEDQPLENRTAGGEFRDAASDGRRAGERNHARHRRSDERVADGAAPRHHHVEHARRQSGFFIDPGEQRAARHRRIRSRLDHDRVAEGDGRRHRSAAQMKREIPRADHADDADGLAVDAAFLARHVGREQAAAHPRREGRHLEGDAVRELELDVGLDPRAARFMNEPVDDLFAALFHDRRGAQDHRRPFTRQRAPPFGIRDRRVLEGVVQVALIRERDADQHVFRVRIHIVHVVTASTAEPAAVDQHRIEAHVGWRRLRPRRGRQGGVHESHRCA